MALSDTLAPGDLVSLTVLGHDEARDQAVVQYDGSITFRLTGPLRAGGLTLEELTESVKVALAPFYKDPVVLLRIENLAKPSVSVFGEVRAPGTVEYVKGITLVEAVRSAGGLSPNGDPAHCYILRKRGNQWTRIRVDLNRVLAGEAADVPLCAGDVVVVPKRPFTFTLAHLQTFLLLINSVLSLYLLLRTL